MKLSDRIRKQVTGVKRPANDAPNYLKSEPTKPIKSASPPPNIKRDALGRLLPGGAVLNPTGRPKGVADLAGAVLERVGGWQRLAEMIEDPDAPRSLQLEVLKLLMDRKYGKAVSVTVSSELAPERLEGLIEFTELPAGDQDQAFALARRFASLEAERQLKQGDSPSEAVLLAPTGSSSTEED